VEGVVVDGGNRGVRRGGCWETVAGAVLDFRVGAARGQAEGRGLNAQSSTGLPLGTAALGTAALLPFPEESVQLAVNLSSQKMRCVL